MSVANSLTKQLLVIAFLVMCCIFSTTSYAYYYTHYNYHWTHCHNGVCTTTTTHYQTYCHNGVCSHYHTAYTHTY